MGVRPGAGIRRYRQGLVILIAALAVSLLFFAGLPSAGAQDIPGEQTAPGRKTEAGGGSDSGGGSSSAEPQILFETEPVRQIRGRNVSGRIAVPWENADQIRVGQPEYPEGLQLITGMYLRPVRRTERWGEQRAAEITFRLRGRQAGIYSLGPFTVSDGERSVSTGTRDVIILEYDERNRRLPLQCSWEVPGKPVYLGQTFPLILRVKNLPEIGFPDRIRTAQPAGALMERTGHLGDIQTVTVNGEEAYHVPAGSWMVTPTQTGQILIPSARIEQAGLVRAAGGKRLDVLPLPAAVEESGAVGRFELSSRMSSPKADPGEAVELVLRIEGRGNLKYLQFPEPRAEGMTLLGKEDSQEIEPEGDGFRGFRERVLRFSSSRPGSYTVEVPGWSSLDPREGQGRRIRRVEPEQYRITVSEGAGDASPGGGLPLLSAREVQASREPGPGGRWYHYLVFLPGLLAFLIPLSLRLRRRFLLGALLVIGMFLSLGSAGSAGSEGPEEAQGLPSWLAEAQELSQQEEWQAAADQWREITLRWPKAAGAWFNLASCYSRLERTADAVWALRQGLRLEPDCLSAQRALINWEETLGLEQQLTTTPGITEGEVFFLLAATFNLFFAAAALLLYRRNGLTVIFFVTAAVLLAGAHAAAGVRGSFLNRPVGILRSQGAVLKKVPGDLGRDWLELPAGTTVRILGEAEDDYLVATGYGLQGWLDQQEIARFR